MLSRLCSAIMTVIPNSRFNLKIISVKDDALNGSSCETGSSSKRSSGDIIITEARFSSCFCPPESLLVSSLNHLFMPNKLDISAVFLLITLLDSPKFSSPKASSCHTLSVTIWLSGFCITYPISAADCLGLSSDIFSPL